MNIENEIDQIKKELEGLVEKVDELGKRQKTEFLGMSHKLRELKRFAKDTGTNMENLYADAKKTVVKAGNASVSFLERKLDISYEKAAELMERLEKDLIVSKPKKNAPRKLLVKSMEEIERLERAPKPPKPLPRDLVYERAKRLVSKAGNVSAEFLEDKLEIGYGRASQLLDKLHKRGDTKPKSQRKSK